MSTVRIDAENKASGSSYTARDIAARITRLRLKQRKSICQLALDAGLNDTVILRVENGERVPKIDTLLKIIDGLETSPAGFFKIFGEY
jgi:transcriptional regulator with XRE-family HTH domain